MNSRPLEGEGKHTPGPWVRGNTGPDKVMLLGGPGQRYVCHIQIQQAGGGWIAEAMEAQREANARLIAAAPAMREALEKIANVASGYARDIALETLRGINANT